MDKSIKQIQIEELIKKELSGRPLDVANTLFCDKETLEIQNYANVVSIKRLGYNDHGPVHMLKSALNAIKVFKLLEKSGIVFSLECDKVGNSEDSLIAVIMASILHDLGMSVARDNHEFMSIQLATPIIEKILKQFYQNNFTKQVILRSVIIEGILGHMAKQKIHSIEAGLVLIGDGCDMEKGRARIPTMISQKTRVGDIHRYSSSSIEIVDIIEGTDKPVRIQVLMNQSVGLFQIEEVLYPKIKHNPAKKYVELYAGVIGKDMLRYL